MTSAQQPVITNVLASSITSTSATVTWTTDQPTTSSVNYGATSSYGTSPGLQTQLVTSHSVTVTGLTPGTTYNYAVVSANSAGLSSTSSNATFTTLAPGATPPNVGYVAFWGINNSGITISWSTDVLANTELAYGTTSALGQFTPVQTALTASHGVVLSGLQSGTTYYFVAESTGANGATGYSTTYSFTTTGVAGAPAPVISLVTAQSITATSAIITWTTDQTSSSLVNYGTAASYGSASTLSTTLATGHSVTLTGLAPGTTYDYDVVSANSAGTSASSANYKFVTSAVSGAPPNITNVAATNVTTTSVTITWTTDQAATDQVNYGTTTSYGLQSALSPALITTHAVTLTGLTPGTTYNYYVVSANSSGTPSTSSNATFMTMAAGATPPYVGYVAFWGINNSGVTISWSTDVLANTELAYGTTSALGQLTPVQTALTASHGVVLSGLQSGTTYYFVAESTAANGATGHSTTYSFTTTGVPATTPAPAISAVTANSVTATSAIITWTTDQAATDQVNYGTTASYGSASALGTALVTSHTVTLTGLTPGTTYDYQAVSANSAGTSASSANYTFATTAATGGVPPAIANVTATNITGTSVTIAWTTDQAATDQVNYGTTASYGLSSALSTTLVTSHSVTLTNLLPGITYNYEVVSTNSASLSAVSTNHTFATLSSVGTPPNLSYVAAWGASPSGVTISWSTDVPATTAVGYGTTPALGQLSPVQTSLSPSHGVILSGLNPGTTYYFAAQSTGANGATGYSTTSTFKTTGSSPPVISGIAAVPGSNNTATISWTTSVPTYSYVQFGSTSAYNKYSANTGLTTNPQPAMGYVPSGVVHYQVVSTDVNGNQVVSPDQQFTEP